MNSSPPRKLAKSPEEVAAASDFLLTMVSDPPASKKSSGPAGAIEALKRAPSTSTPVLSLPPSLAKSPLPRPSAACVSDAPVTGGDWGAKKGELLFMVWRAVRRDENLSP